MRSAAASAPPRTATVDTHIPASTEPTNVEASVAMPEPLVLRPQLVLGLDDLV
jgi:hypothetical protein